MVRPWTGAGPRCVRVGFFGPYIVGQKASETNVTKGLFVLAASFLVAAVLLAEPLKAARQEREVAGGGRQGARRPLETPVRAWASV